jgi:hypothetical protein
VSLGNRSDKAKKKYPRDPYLQHAALDTTACPVPASRDRRNFANDNNLARKPWGLPSAPDSHSANATAVLQLVWEDAKELFVVFSQGKPLLAIFMRPQ